MIPALALDTETECFTPARMSPRPVCLSIASDSEGTLIPTPEARQVFLDLLASGAPLLTANGPYDLCCALAWWDCTAEVLEALERDQIGDVWVIERLAEIGGLTPRKDLSLANLHQAHGLGVLPKDDVRTSYGPLLNRPLSEYSEAQIQYATDDACATLRVFRRQEKRWIDPGHIHWADVAMLTRKRTWLEATRVYGLRTNPERLADLARGVTERITELRQQVADLGIIRADGTKDSGVLQALVIEAYTREAVHPRPGQRVIDHVREIAQAPDAARRGVPLTQKPREKKDAPPRKKPWVPSVRTDHATLEESGDDRLIAFAEYGSWCSTETILPKYALGAIEPIHTKWGMADSTRTTSSAPPVQNLGKKNGIRECFIPRPGFVFVSVDHGGLENATLAQCCIWYARKHGFADFVRGGGDLHCLVGAAIHGCSYEEALRLHAEEEPSFENARQAAKPVNFGSPGGAGWRRLQASAKLLQGFDWTDDDAKRYKAAWRAACPDVVAYHAWVDSRSDGKGRYTVPIPGTTITRRGCTYCSACNNGFQALGAVVEAYVGWEIWRECLTGRTRAGAFSVLGLCHIVNYVHDEFILECPREFVHECAERLEWFMAEVPLAIMPDVPLRSDAKAMAFWSKKAKRVIRDGRLQVWEG
jgi:hypothetical protein